MERLGNGGEENIVEEKNICINLKWKFLYTTHHRELPSYVTDAKWHGGVFRGLEKYPLIFSAGAKRGNIYTRQRKEEERGISVLVGNFNRYRRLNYNTQRRNALPVSRTRVF